MSFITPPRSTQSPLISVKENSEYVFKVQAHTHALMCSQRGVCEDSVRVYYLVIRSLKTSLDRVICKVKPVVHFF